MTQAKRFENLLTEADRARTLLEQHADVVVDHRNLVSTTMLTQTLFALWDSGFYEFIRARQVVSLSDAQELGYAPRVFEVVLQYLVGRGILAPRTGGLALTEHGEALHNVFTRGLIKLYVGGYGPLLSNLGPALRGEIPLEDPRLKRIPRAVASGTEDINCVHTIPAVIRLLREESAGCVLDLGCGTGGFLIQLALLDPSLTGVGIDIEAEAIDGARQATKRATLESRLEFRCAAVGADALDIPKHVRDRIDTISCMFLLHEFGRDGEAAISRVVSRLVEQFPDRRLIVLESDPAEPNAYLHAPPPHFGQLDYWYVHPLSLQGPPMSPSRWEQLFLAAGAKGVSHRPTFPSSIARIYRVQL